MQALDGVDDLLIAGTSTPKYDYHCPLLSLPLAFKTTPDSIPNRVPYLKAERARVTRWRTHLTEPGFKIAINWQGNHKNPLDKGRSFPLTMFKEISKIEGVRLISLQKKNGMEQLRSSQSVIRVEELPTDFDQEGNEFLDSAAVMHCVDLVISSDTSIAHLAGSLGVETWVPLKFVPDWRWMTADMKKNAWYPTVQLYRQSNAGDWEKPFREITSAIYDRVQASDM